ncbi:hypothetical protein ANCCAN_26669 [Ancylostoma caninum]|uniref:Phlebovirus glycoprotein G2 fusion domain-containing protein n=1 Tax=Ancylostoma caninum TaxID=29170 RepID=A0A368F659_ANCCA|nr:hypothetical protein ANCCAN_26669 [Ancylostoma caninum]
MATIVKVNPFKKDACIRLQNNQSTVLEIEFHWDGLRLLCERTTLMHTRNIIQKVVDSKRCPHMGSCVRNKCSDINSTSLLPELAIGNKYPGRTACIESCGGPGCDCFYMSSGCLFYRIYGVPSDNTIYELFKCLTWQEEVKAKVHVRKAAGKLLSYVIDLRPNIPVQLPPIEVTLSVLSFPAIDILNTNFITDVMKNTTAMWTSNTLPHLQCPSELSARNMQCNLHDSCECTPAESQVTCKCQNQNVKESFEKIENVLPVTLPFVKFSRHPTYTVMAQIDKDVSAEVIVNIKETVDTAIVDVADEICNIEDANIQGCYRCIKGATATVSCSTLNTNISAEIDCGVDTFTVPCSPQSTTSSLQFLLSNARVQLNCSVKCGTSTKYFEITGILKYIHPILETIREGISEHEHNITTEYKWPDFGHILDVYTKRYEVVIITVIEVVSALLISYFLLSSACCRLLFITFTLLKNLPLYCFRLIVHITCSLFKHLSSRKMSQPYQKLITKTL